MEKKYDDLFIKIADYVFEYQIKSELAFKTAHIALLDSLACAFLALKQPLCRDLLGPFVPGTVVPLGARLPGTSFELDPIKAAFDIGTCIRWLDYNDSWLAKEWGHPSDNLGGLLAVGDYLCRGSKTSSQLNMKDLFEMMIKAYEIQGVLALDNAFNQVGLDHVILVKVATSAVVSKWFGLSKSQCRDVLSHAFIDGHALRTYRHAPHTGPRKSWAAGDATSRAVFLNWVVKQGQIGYPQALTVKQWGFSDVLFQGNPVLLNQAFSAYVMENILFKVRYPAEFHAQTAVEAAILLQPKILPRLAEIERIEIRTQEPALRIIHKTGPLHNYADRDHCLQYMIAIGLLFGDLKPESYSNEYAQDPRIDLLRSKMQVQENKAFSDAYLDPNKRAIANEVKIIFKQGDTVSEVLEYPLGHRRRREEAMPYLEKKYQDAVLGHFDQKQTETLLNYWHQFETLLTLSISEFMDSLVLSP